LKEVLISISGDKRIWKVLRGPRSALALSDRFRAIAHGSLATIVFFLGCSSSPDRDNSLRDMAHYQAVATQIEAPLVATPSDESLACTPPPRSIRDLSHVEYRNMTLQEVMQTALTNSRVLLDLGGVVLRVPESVQTTYSIAIQETDPEFGPEAALSAFDAQFGTSLYSEKNNQQYNNVALGNNGLFVQNYDEWDTSIAKRGVTGGQYSIRNVIDFDRNTNIANTFPNGSFDTYVEGAFRQPLLQGAGVEYNRIAGPGAKPGIYNGVLVARIRTDISEADFEVGLRDFIANVENAYWDLYFAYRDLDVKIQARDEALETWRRIRALNLAGGARKGGEADKEAQAREQYFRFQGEVQDSLAGRLLEGTRTYNGSPPGTFRANPGVQVAERRLRLLMNLPATGEQLIRPAEEPTLSPITFDWTTLMTEALVRREELRRQRWVVKSRELELVASRNFLKPNLDLVGRYRLRGFGHELGDTDPGEGASAYGNMFSAEHQEWQVGAEFSMPFGFRQGHAAVRNADLRVSQARAILREAERTVVHELSAAVTEVDRAFTILQTDIYRAKAAKDQLQALEAVYEAKQEGFFEVLDFQRRLAEAVSHYYQSRVEYALAIRNVHFEKGSLLDYCNVRTSEGAWPEKAYRDAARRAEHRGRPKPINYAFARPPVVSAGSPAEMLARTQTISADPTQQSTFPPGNRPEAVPPPRPEPAPGPISLPTPAADPVTKGPM
jgi:outer membrane protein TolC